MTPRAVVDTSALVPPTLRRELQEAAALGAYTAIWSPWIIAELNRVLTWHWLTRPLAGRPVGDGSLANWRRCRTAANRMMALLLPTFELVHPLPPYPPAWPALTDVDDHPIWAAAVAGQATHVVSENRRHFPPPDAEGRRRHASVEYLTGRDFLDRLAGDGF